MRGEGAPTVPGMMEALLLPPKPLDLEKYQAMAEDLAFELPPIQQQTGTKRMGSMDGGREGSPKQRREEVEDEEVRLGRDIGEVFPVGGVSGKIDRFLGVKTGEIVVMQPRQQPMRVLFHVAQVFFKHQYQKFFIWVISGLGEIGREKRHPVPRRLPSAEPLDRLLHWQGDSAEC